MSYIDELYGARSSPATREMFREACSEVDALRVQLAQANAALQSAKEEAERARGRALALQYRVLSYLGNGGLFNPEHMEHDKVRDLIMDLSDYLPVSRNEAVEKNRADLDASKNAGKGA